jgi:DNA-binding protein H-NS
VPTTDDQLAKKREQVETLRQQVAQEVAKRVEREAAAVNDVTAVQLDEEIGRLQAQLAAAKDANKDFNSSLTPPPPPVDVIDKNKEV